jgi:hypothetical protein
MGNDELLIALVAENRRLRELLVRHGISADPPEIVAEAPEAVAPAFSETEKIRIFRNLFRGREDVYAVRWERADGRKGYMPRSERDWRAFNAASQGDKERVDRETRKYFPLDDEAVRAHLQGKLSIGIYPLLQDETCWFLAADFDKAAWRIPTHSDDGEPPPARARFLRPVFPESRHASQRRLRKSNCRPLAEEAAQ